MILRSYHAGDAMRESDSFVVWHSYGSFTPLCDLSAHRADKLCIRQNCPQALACKSEFENHQNKCISFPLGDGERQVTK